MKGTLTSSLLINLRQLPPVVANTRLIYQRKKGVLRFDFFVFPENFYVEHICQHVLRTFLSSSTQFYLSFFAHFFIIIRAVFSSTFLCMFLHTSETFSHRCYARISSSLHAFFFEFYVFVPLRTEFRTHRSFSVALS